MTQRAPVRDEVVTVERLERAVHFLAYIVLRHGEKYGPLLEWLDDELQQMKKAPSARDRAQQILNRMTREVSARV
ncbi:hypothetical protein GCM10007913_11370 [Devosia yakushimensis]|uniref:Uncharacterized protein n=1 Tax=Devosia yakushimensis TaxID=470028 RepID=A0ABQ5UDC6_9HYPH|nr:hypothetical protein [Devosia yakushimensis]GLQ09205.1 hypothetical protein GCM10007913_11370 [Devosia yakushimensis]